MDSRFPGDHLLHFTRSKWTEVALPQTPSSFFPQVEDFLGEALVRSMDSLWLRGANQWTRIGNPGSCTSFLTVSARAAWCLAADGAESVMTEVAPDGHVTRAAVHSTVAFLQAGLAGDAWFSEENVPVLGHVMPSGGVRTLAVSSPVGVISRGGRVVWFTETDHVHYGFVDGHEHLHELTYLKGFPMLELIGAPRGAWLHESLQPGRIIVRHVDLDGSQKAYVQDVGATEVAPDGTLWAASREFPTIIRTTEDGTMTRYALPCHPSRLFFMPAPDNAIWFRSPTPHCRGLADDLGVHLRDLPLVGSVQYK